MKEIIQFLLEVKIQDQDGKIIQLSKKQDLEIDWVVVEEKEIGILNPGEETTYIDPYFGKRVYRNSLGEIIRFSKDGKDYNIQVKINSMSKGWFRDNLTSCGFYPAEGEKFTIWDGSPESDRGSTMPVAGWFVKEDKSLTRFSLKPLKQRWSGIVLVFLLSLVILFIAVYLIKRMKKK